MVIVSRSWVLDTQFNWPQQKHQTKNHNFQIAILKTEGLLFHFILTIKFIRLIVSKAVSFDSILFEERCKDLLIVLVIAVGEKFVHAKCTDN